MKSIIGITLGMVLLAGIFLLSTIPAGAAFFPLPLYSGAWAPANHLVKYQNITFHDIYAVDNNFKFFIYNKDTGDELTVFNKSRFSDSKSIIFLSENGNYFASLGNRTLNLGDKPHFWLGFDLGAGSIYEYSHLLWSGKDEFMIDLGDKTFRSSNASPVPLPASVWLLGSALMGLAGFGRRFINLP